MQLTLSDKFESSVPSSMAWRRSSSDFSQPAPFRLSFGVGSPVFLPRGDIHQADVSRFGFILLRSNILHKGHMITDASC